MTVQTTCFLYLIFLSTSYVFFVRIVIWYCLPSHARLTGYIRHLKAVYIIDIKWNHPSKGWATSGFFFFSLKHIPDANLEPKHLTGLTQLEKYKWLMVVVTWRWIALSLKLDICLQKVMQSQITKLISRLDSNHCPEAKLIGYVARSIFMLIHSTVFFFPRRIRDLCHVW